MNQRYKAEHLHPDRGDVNNLSRFLALHSLDLYLFFLFNDAATPEIYTLSLHDALPICPGSADRHNSPWWRRTATRKWSSENGRPALPVRPPTPAGFSSGDSGAFSLTDSARPRWRLNWWGGPPGPRGSPPHVLPHEHQGRKNTRLNAT